MEQPQEEMSFLAHLEILRWHIIRATMVVIAVALLAFFFKTYIFKYIILPHTQGDFPTYQFFCEIGRYFGSETDFCQQKLPLVIQNRTMTGQFSATLWISFWTGLIVGFPYLMYEMWRFISPGLYQKERKMAKGFIGITSILFFVGVLFGYYIIAPLSIHFFATYSVVDGGQMVKNEIDIASYIDMLRSSVISCGLIFELPVVIYFLAKLGIVTADFLRKYRKHAIIVTLILAAIITPPDVASQVIVSIPILILYEVSIFVAKIVQKRQERTKLN